ncbi:anti-anti-sigma factor [Nostoc sp. PCC 7524]|uniref:STAS domain-containing protein n=1 Tax=Nostoc sp. (strain ATCC 29411 / PCC 7524) TaxID=28072 RepID=UPI00029EE24B|nr:STAS domain-containing protein [Nostoc sp. PCC 7524]AFY49998.1 anti-anti-sigma factor [Nostoc sp. PCC 7524]
MQAVVESPKSVVISPQGYLNATNALEFERDLSTTLAQNDVSSLSVDLSQVESLDSSGLMALVSALKVAQSLGKGFRLDAVSPAIKIIFELTQLDQVFQICEEKN